MKHVLQRAKRHPPNIVLTLDLEERSVVESAGIPWEQVLLPPEQRSLQLSKVVDALHHAGTDKHVQGLVACIGRHLSSEGLAELQELRNAVHDFRSLKQDSVPTVAFTDSFGGVEACGTYAYYLASAFKQVYVQPEGTWGVTGLCGGRYFMKSLLDKLQIRPQVFVRMDCKDCYSHYTGRKFSKPEAEAAKAYLQGWLHQIVSHIAADRSLHYDTVAAAVDAAPLSAAEAVAQGLLTASRYRSQACSHITTDAPPRQCLNTAATAEHCYRRTLSCDCDAHFTVRALSDHTVKLSCISPMSHSRMEAFSNDWHSGTCLGSCHTVPGLVIPDNVTPRPQVSLTFELAEGATGGAMQMGTVNVSKKVSSGLLGPGECSSEVLRCKAVSISDYIRALDWQQQTWAVPSILRAGLQHLPGVRKLLCKPAIAVITATGEIHTGNRQLGADEQIASNVVCRQLQRAKADRSVRAVVLRIDSPGECATGSDAIREEVISVRRSGKPVVVSMGNMATSGGYLISVAADEIVAQPGTLTGSIGVAFCKLNMFHYFKRLGIDAHLITAGNNADMAEPTTAYTPEQQRKVDQSIDQVYHSFLAKVAAGRQLAEVRKVARGRVWTGQDALELGLVDKLGGLRDAIAAAKQRAGLPQEEGKVKVFQLEPESKSLLGLIWQALQQDTQTGISDLPELTQPIAAGSSLREVLAGRSGQKVMMNQLRAAFMAQHKVRTPLLQLAV
ncbi:TPA: hypothetical protein ACH3X3_002859 [Trebouxia sp. C0006]